MRERLFPSNHEPYPEKDLDPNFELVVATVEKEVDGYSFFVPVQQKIPLPLPDPNEGITVDDFDPVKLSEAGYNVKSGIVDRGFTDVEAALDKIP